MDSGGMSERDARAMDFRNAELAKDSNIELRKQIAELKQAVEQAQNQVIYCSSSFGVDAIEKMVETIKVRRPVGLNHAVIRLADIRTYTQQLREKGDG